MPAAARTRRRALSALPSFESGPTSAVERGRVPRGRRRPRRRHRCAEAADERRDARLERLGQPDAEVEAERLRDLLAEVGADRAAGDAPHDLADEVAVRDRVVAVRRCPAPRPAPGARARRIIGSHASASSSVAARRPTRARRGARAGSDRDALLAGLRELGPVLGDRRVEVELALPARAGSRRSPSRPWWSRTRRPSCPRSHGRSVASSAMPPQRSTTFSPRWYAANAAPTSSPSAKFFSNWSRTFSKPGCGPTVDRHADLPTHRREWRCRRTSGQARPRRVYVPETRAVMRQPPEHGRLRAPVTPVPRTLGHDRPGNHTSIVPAFGVVAASVSCVVHVPERLLSRPGVALG